LSNTIYDLAPRVSPCDQEQELEVRSGVPAQGDHCRGYARGWFHGTEKHVALTLALLFPHIWLTSYLAPFVGYCGCSGEAGLDLEYDHASRSSWSFFKPPLALRATRSPGRCPFPSGNAAPNRQESCRFGPSCTSRQISSRSTRLATGPSKFRSQSRISRAYRSSPSRTANCRWSTRNIAPCSR
jgi:hypothetical protein